MLQGLYAAASGMEATQNQLNAISNDMANLNTTGYQATEVGFQDLLYSSGGSSSGSPPSPRAPARPPRSSAAATPRARFRTPGARSMSPSRAPAISRYVATTARSA